MSYPLVTIVGVGVTIAEADYIPWLARTITNHKFAGTWSIIIDGQIWEALFPFIEFTFIAIGTVVTATDWIPKGRAVLAATGKWHGAVT